MGGDNGVHSVFSSDCAPVENRQLKAKGFLLTSAGN